MTVFKYYFKILYSYKFLVIMYTLMLIFFGAFSMQTSESTTNFTAQKPDIILINNDENVGITKSLNDYILNNAVKKDIAQDKIEDALFYRDVNYIITIPNGFNKDFLDGKNPNIEVQSTGDYSASYMEMILNSYLKVANTYRQSYSDVDEMTVKIEETLNSNIETQITSKIDTNSLNKSSFFFNFSNYTLLAGCITVITTVLSSYREMKIRKRTIISSMKYTKYNRQLFLGNLMFALTLWALYVLLSVIIVKDVMFTMHGLLYIINSFVFTICCLAFALVIGNLLTNKNAINGIVNVVALGSSFLCGAFVPIEMLPAAVLNVGRIFPSYWYIQNNEIIKKLEIINFKTLEPYFINLLVIVGFIILAVILTNIISRKKQKI